MHQVNQLAALSIALVVVIFVFLFCCGVLGFGWRSLETNQL